MQDHMIPEAPEAKSRHDFEDLSEMLGGLRILLPSAQLLSAFMILLPFNSVFLRIARAEKWAFLAIFLCSLTSLVLFSAPAIQHRLMRPLKDRGQFKALATRQIVAGALMLSVALILSTHLVTAQVFGHPLDNAAASFVAAIIGVFWWIIPNILKARARKK